MTIKKHDPIAPKQHTTMPPVAADALWTTHGVSHLLQVNPSTIVHWTQRYGLICHRTPGGHRRIVMGDLAAFLAEHKMPMPFVIV